MRKFFIIMMYVILPIFLVLICSFRWLPFGLDVTSTVLMLGMAIVGSVIAFFVGFAGFLLRKVPMLILIPHLLAISAFILAGITENGKSIIACLTGMIFFGFSYAAIKEDLRNQANGE